MWYPLSGMDVDHVAFVVNQRAGWQLPVDIEVWCCVCSAWCPVSGPSVDHVPVDATVCRVIEFEPLDVLLELPL